MHEDRMIDGYLNLSQLSPTHVSLRATGNTSHYHNNTVRATAIWHRDNHLLALISGLRKLLFEDKLDNNGKVRIPKCLIASMHEE